MTTKEVLKQGLQKLKIKNIASADAEVLLMESLKKNNKNINKVWFYTNLDKNLEKSITNHYFKLIKRRQKHEPVAYITGHKEFYGLDFYVNKNVLIPRPETELLVEEALKEITNNCHLTPNTYAITDIGTGSGCIIVALATKSKIPRPRQAKQGGQNSKFKMYGIDISAEALKVARLNAKKHKVDKQIKFLQGNLLAPLPEKVNLIIANLPYVLKNEIEKLPEDIKKFEPKIAFYGKKDGLYYYRRLLKQVNSYLKPDGKLFLEIGYQQKETISKLIKDNLPQAKIKIIKDYAGWNRIILINT